jgi:putative PIN family toxin of toxin-antitoxin system
MRVAIDTNVLVSGVFFGGPPLKVLEAWRDDRYHLVVSLDVFEEYRRVGERLEARFPGVSLAPFLELIAAHAEIIDAPQLSEPVCDDPDDDAFFACALAGDCGLIISGDKGLLAASGSLGVRVLTPRKFLESIP